MRADGAVFGVEVSGHIFFGELDGADDSLLATLLLARILSDSGTPLSQLMSTVPETVITPDIRIPVVAESRTEIMDRFAAAFGHLPTETLDGVRVSWQHGWALCRASVTEPAMTFRIEADTAADLASILAEIGDALPEIRDDLFSKAGAS
jgi:phosphomannomutase